MTDNRRNTPPPESKKYQRASTAKEPQSGDITGQYEGIDLEFRRALRPVDERVRRLEKKHDALKQAVQTAHIDFGDEQTDLRAAHVDLRANVKIISAQVAGVGGRLDGQEAVIANVFSIVKDRATIEQASLVAKVDIDKARELARVDIDKERQLDRFAARRSRRKLALKGMGLLASSGIIVELLHLLKVL
jgi:hypothetical protein